MRRFPRLVPPTVLSLLSAALSLSVAGCSSVPLATGPVFQSEVLEGRSARLVLYWPSDSFVGSGLRSSVLVNGIEVGKIHPKGYVDAHVDAGETTLAVRYESFRDGKRLAVAQNLLVDLQPGRETYVRYETAAGLTPQLVLKEIPAGPALAELATLRRAWVYPPK